MRYVVTEQGKDHNVDVGAPGERGVVTVEVDGVKHQVHAVVLPSGAVSLVVDGHSYDVEMERPVKDALSPRVNVRVRGEVLALEVLDQRRKQLANAGGRKGGGVAAGNILSPMPGKVVKILKPAGSTVAAGEGVIVVEAMKMENELKAAAAGTVKDVKVTEGQAVEAGALLVVLAP